ncbi:hypothetical protein PG995_009829 [Apiospora arundinis]
MVSGRLDDVRGEDERRHHEVVDHHSPGPGWRRGGGRRHDAVDGGGRCRGRGVAVMEVVFPGDGEGVLVEVAGVALARGRDADDAVVPPVLVVVGGIGSRWGWGGLVVGGGLRARGSGRGHVVVFLEMMHLGRRGSCLLLRIGRRRELLVFFEGLLFFLSHLFLKGATSCIYAIWHRPRMSTFLITLDHFATAWFQTIYTFINVSAGHLSRYRQQGRAISVVWMTQQCQRKKEVDGGWGREPKKGTTTNATSPMRFGGETRLFDIRPWIERRAGMAGRRTQSSKGSKNTKASSP